MQIKPSPARPELDRLVAAAAKRWQTMTPAEQEAILREQRDGWVRAEMSWPRDCPYR